MPGRTSTRTTRTARTGAGTRSARSSAIEVPDEGPATSLRTRIVQVFSDAQKTTATQRKLVVTLRKIQEEVCFEPPTQKARKAREDEDDEDDFDEQHFNQEVIRNILRVMNVKKSEPIGDRVVRFVTLFLKYASEKDQKNAAAANEDASEPTPSSRLNTQVLSTLLRFFASKDKTVRFRAVQMVTQMLNSLQQIDSDVYTVLRLSLQKRLRDKEPSVRIQAVLGLGRLNGQDDEDEEDEDSDDEAGTITERLVNVMYNDPDAQVRRTILANIPSFPSTGRYQFERARDTDPATRRIVYNKILPGLQDFRLLSLEIREKLIRWGLKDRDDAVRKATAKLFYERWIEDCASKRDTRPEEERVPGSMAPPSREALCELLERLDIVHTGAEGGMAHTAMKEFWAGRPDYLDAIEFDKEFWLDLDPPAAFVMRSLNDYCQDADDDRTRQIIEDKLPEVSNFAHILKRQLNITTEAMHKLALMDEGDPEFDEAQEIAEDADFVAQQLLHVSLTLNYSDEQGRRTMYNLTRGAIAHPALPEECTKLAIEVLRIVCGSRGEADFCALVMEAIQEVRDTLLDADEDGETTGLGDDAESFHSAQSETSSPPPESKKASKPEKVRTEEEKEAHQYRESLVYQKCLHIVQCTLQNVTCELEKDTNLTSMLNTLIVPAVPSHNQEIRERGVICLGIASLLSEVSCCYFYIPITLTSLESCGREPRSLLPLLQQRRRHPERDCFANSCRHLHHISTASCPTASRTRYDGTV
jgi:condensin complex subunit 3